jgi:L,D-peptidoglycan transpeptidase YkuD (ErfK/YbiS/YcfS/YnhG family)
LIARRSFFWLPVQLTAAHLAGAVPVAYESLEYRGGQLNWSGGSAAAAVGRSGVRTDKHEGDGATPAGIYPLLHILYRQDRIAPPVSRLPVSPLVPGHGWVDDPTDPNYNRLVLLPYPARTEPMWREDELYDALVVIGYNTDPVVPGAGSAIFLHIATADFAPTAGCVAVRKEVLLGVLPLLGPGSTITIGA